jgi:hypothetical protein
MDELTKLATAAGCLKAAAPKTGGAFHTPVLMYTHSCTVLQYVYMRREEREKRSHFCSFAQLMGPAAEKLRAALAATPIHFPDVQVCRSAVADLGVVQTSSKMHLMSASQSNHITVLRITLLLRRRNQSAMLEL